MEEAFPGEGDGDFDWQFLGGALVLLGAAGRCQRCFAALEKVQQFCSRILCFTRGVAYCVASVEKVHGVVHRKCILCLHEGKRAMAASSL